MNTATPYTRTAGNTLLATTMDVLRDIVAATPLMIFIKAVRGTR